MIYKYQDKIGILVKGKLVEQFTNKCTKSLCEKEMTRWIVINKNYEFGKFSVLKL